MRNDSHSEWLHPVIECFLGDHPVVGGSELEADFQGTQPSLVEQLAALAELDLNRGIYGSDEAVAAYPAADCEDAGQPAGQSVDQLLAEYDQAYLYGVGGVFLGSPGAYLRFRREEAEAERYYREICIRQEAACAARDAAAAA
jgi:hypothetical protein